MNTSLKTRISGKERECLTQSTVSPASPATFCICNHITRNTHAVHNGTKSKLKTEAERERERKREQEDATYSMLMEQAKLSYISSYAACKRPTADEGETSPLPLFIAPSPQCECQFCIQF